MEYITSDLHFDQRNILRFCNNTRSKFVTSQHHFKYRNNNSNLICFTREGLDNMNNSLINEWNSIVKCDDVIYHLGDFCLGGVIKSVDILKQLNGVKQLIVGNHDNKLVKYIKANNLMVS
jgi:calcineurin-like phosphoesterase family protein